MLRGQGVQDAACDGEYVPGGHAWHEPSVEYPMPVISIIYNMRERERERERVRERCESEK